MLCPNPFESQPQPCQRGFQITIVVFKPRFHCQATVTLWFGSMLNTGGVPLMTAGTLSIPLTRSRTMYSPTATAGTVKSSVVGCVGSPGLLTFVGATAREPNSREA